MSTSTGLPPIDPSRIPEGVRAQGQKAIGLYESALGFEGVLDQQLTQALTATLQTTDSDGQSTNDPATSMTLQLLPGALSQGLIENGGLGLAPSLYKALGGTMSASVSPQAADGTVSGTHGRTDR